MGTGATQAYLRALRRDLAIYAFIAGYGVLTFVLSRAVGAPSTFQPLSVVKVYVSSVAMGLNLIGIWLAVRSLPKPRPLEAFRGELRALMAPDRVAGASMILALAVFMSIFGSAKALLPHIVPFWADPLLAEVDAVLAGGSAPWNYLPRSPTLTRVVDQFYGMGWFAVMFISICAGALTRGAYRRQYLWTFLLAWTLLGNVVACVMMSGGPIYFEALTGAGDFKAIADDVTAHGPWSLMVRNQLWNGYVGGIGDLAQGISAFPSLHLAITTLFVLQAKRIDLRLAWVAVALSVWILGSSVYLGWHYAVDGYFSIAVTILIWKAVGLALRVSDERLVLKLATT